MKKWFNVMFCCLITLSLCSCGTNKDDDLTDMGNQAEVNIQKKYEDLKYIYNEIYFGEYTVDIPEYVMSWNIGHCIHLGEDKMIIFDHGFDFGSEDYGYKLEDIKKPSDVVRKMKKQIITVALAYDNSYYAKDLIIEKEKSMNINGFDFVKTNAYIETETGMGITGNKIHLVIYSTIKNGYPIYIEGIDLTDEQKSITEIEEITDKIADTFRELEE